MRQVLDDVLNWIVTCSWWWPIGLIAFGAVMILIGSHL